MKVRVFLLLRNSIWSVLRLLASAVIVLSLSAYQPALALDATGQLAAEILTAQQPLLESLKRVDRYIMPIQTTLPWGAIGFIDNGCTGVLIDSQHILAAAHCFVRDDTGSWQTQAGSGLTFFPNYHPDRTNPPRYAIDRAVVGTRVETGGEYLPSDWGIGHLTTPVTIFPSMEIQPLTSSQYPFAVIVAGYARDESFFPQKEKSYPQPSPGGYCQFFGPNCWWTPAVVDPYCAALSNANNVLILSRSSCTIIGGNSGSPIIWDAGSPDAPAYRITGVIHGGGTQPDAARFLDAPRFAAGVALATYNDGSTRTQVFATDSDSDRVVSRYREGTTLQDGFTPFGNLGTVPSPGRIAALILTNNKPQVMVISEDGNLYTTHVDSSNHWQPWTTLDKPAGVTGFLDVDAAYDVDGVNQLYVIGNNHVPYTRRRLTNDPYAEWGTWQALASASGVLYNRISAIRRADGTQQVFLVSTTGIVDTLSQLFATPDSVWSAIVPFSDTGQPPTIADLDASWTEDEQVQVFAVDTNGELWTRMMKTSSPADGWNDWQPWQIALFAPRAGMPPVIDDIVTLTASQWQEDTGGDIVPVVLATDRQGNIYYTTHSRSAGWDSWRSFYQ